MDTHADETAGVRALAARVLGVGAARRLAFRLDGSPGGPERFEIRSSGATIEITGNSRSALTAGLHVYLREVAGLHISWYGSRLDLPDPPPPVPEPIRRSSWARHRYFLNYCCFSYSLAHWRWPQWERLIDWMALNGVNRPLAMTGQEAVWLRVGWRIGLAPEEMNDFIPGAAYLPFGWMGCLDGWGGPLPATWCDRHEALAKQILARERELGMTPVLQGFTGHLPAALLRRHPDARVHTIHWHEWKTHLLDPMDPLFAQLSAVYAEEQARLFGTDHFYAADTFIEMTPPSGDLEYLAQLGRAIYQGMAARDAEAVWVLQGWAFMDKRSFWTQPRIEAFLGGVPDGRMLILDLHCESRPMWDQTKAFTGKPWLWCNVQNFGRNTQMTAALDANNKGLQAARRAPQRGNLCGLGMVNEGLCYNPVAYAFFFEQGWRDRAVDVRAWAQDYIRHRYGRHSAPACQAWDLLVPAVYAHFQPERSEHLRRPSESVPALATPCDGTLETAWGYLLAAAPDLGPVDAYRFDLVNLGRQVLSNRATQLKRALQEALGSRQRQRFAGLVQDMRALLLDLDELVGTRPEFLLGIWLAEARSWGDSESERIRLEEGARRQITIWGHTDILRDYARKEWAGLLKNFYAVRWQRYGDSGLAALEGGAPFDAVAFERDLLEWEREWIRGHESYPIEPSGDSVDVSVRLFDRYQIPFAGSGPT